MIIIALSERYGLYALSIVVRAPPALRGLKKLYNARKREFCSNALNSQTKVKTFSVLTSNETAIIPKIVYSETSQLGYQPSKIRNLRNHYFLFL